MSAPARIAETPVRPTWFVARVAEARAETPTAARLVLDVPGWPGSDAGSHLDVRLTAPDGYQATRSYSVAESVPGGSVTLAVEELPDGEVSPFLVRDLRAGDEIEIHGPLGSFFRWRPDGVRPVQLVAGGSGVVPLYAMAAVHAAAADPAPFRLIYSVRTPEDVFFRDELRALVGASFRLDLVYTRRAPERWEGAVDRLTREALAAVTIAAAQLPRVFVCGSTGFVETVAAWLIELGHPPQNILTERFGGLT